MRRKLRGIKLTDIRLDLSLYRVEAPIPGAALDHLSVIDIWPEGVERTILFVHGYAGCAETWEHQINYFSENYRVVVPDLRGHGQSDAPYTSYTMSEMVADLRAVARNLKLPEKFTLVGHSFGGSIAVEFAHAYPERVDKLILLATANRWPMPRLLLELYRFPSAILRPFWRYRPRWNAELHAFKRMMTNNLSRWRGEKLMSEITVPTLIITGARDNYFPRHIYAEAARYMPRAEVVDIAASKHKVQLERHQAVNRAIERFIVSDRQRTSWRGQSAAADLVAKRPWLDAYSPGVPHTVPIPRRPLTAFLEGAAAWLPKRPAIIFENTRLTYEQLHRSANQFAHVLYGSGVKPGDRVMVFLPNCPQFVIAFYGALRAGGVAVLSYPTSSTEELVRQARLAEAKVLVTLATNKELVAAMRQDGIVREVIVTDPTRSPQQEARGEAGSWQERKADATAERAAVELDAFGPAMFERMKDAPIDFPAIAADSNTLAAIVFPRGSDVPPKGVCLTHANLVANAVQVRHWFPDLRYGEETVLAVTPFSHCYGMTMAMNMPIAIGATLVLISDFQLEQVLGQIHAHHPTLFPGVPAMFAAISQAPDVRSWGMSAIKHCTSSGAPLHVEVQEAFEKLAQARIVECYSLTEASAVTHADPITNNDVSGSIGTPIPNTDARIVHLSTGEMLSPGLLGELQVRGPQVMTGYWGEDEATSWRTSDGWLRTGDIAVTDAAGFFRIVGHKRDVIVTGQHIVYPRDVEEVIYEHPRVQEVAVLGAPDPDLGYRVKAFVVPRLGEELSQHELLELCQRRLDPAAVPAEIEFRSELPKSFEGKVLRHLLV